MKQSFLYKTLLTFAAVGIAAVPTEAFAHQVQTNYILNGLPSTEDSVSQNESLEIQSTFSNGQPLKGAKVSIYAPNRPFGPYATGKTDAQGRFSFQPEASIPGEWEVKIKREGHADILYVPVTEEGIEAEAVASGAIDDVQDVHYASSPLMAVGSIVIAAAAIGFARVGKKEAK